jgi:hypothetical protein
MLRDFCAVCAPEEQLSVARTVKLKVPAVVGEPEIAPVDVLIESPGGREPEITL